VDISLKRDVGNGQPVYLIWTPASQPSLNWGFGKHANGAHCQERSAGEDEQDSRSKEVKWIGRVPNRTRKNRKAT